MKNYPSGYYTPSGYIGFLSDGRKMLFSSEQDYLDYVSEDHVHENLA